MPSPIGVLALQGDFREHRRTFDSIGVETIEVRTKGDLTKVSGLVIPGGESTVIHKLAVAYELFEPIKNAIANGLPAFGTCAGLILLAKTILDGTADQRSFGGLDISVRRNAFGGQLDSFETDLTFAGIEGEPLHAAFIRAPIVETVSNDVEILSTLPDGRIVGVRQGNVMGISFHPEVTSENRVHELFANMVYNR